MPTFLNENAAAIAVATAGIALPLFTIPSKISINFPPSKLQVEGLKQFLHL